MPFYFVLRFGEETVVMSLKELALLLVFLFASMFVMVVVLRALTDLIAMLTDCVWLPMWRRVVKKGSHER